MKRVLTLLFVLSLVGGSAWAYDIPMTVSYQGKLTRPTGAPVPDGDYQITIRLYDDPVAGRLRWGPEGHMVTTRNGLFSVLLGTGKAPEPLTPDVFKLPLWVEVQVEDDLPMTPRQPLSSAPYAFRSAIAEVVSEVPTHFHDADYVNVTGDTMSGPLTALRFTSTVATGTAPLSVSSTTKVTNLNADFLDGKDSSEFSPSNHNHDTTYINANADEIMTGTLTAYRFLSSIQTGTPPLAVNSTTKVDNLNVDFLDGKDSSEFASASHNHDGSYLKLTGGALSGMLTVPDIAYSAPKTAYLNIPSSAFTPGSSGLQYTNDIVSVALTSGGPGSFVAPILLPDGAVLNEATFYWYDASPLGDIQFKILHNPVAYPYVAETVAETRSGGSTGQGNTTVNFNFQVNNSQGGLRIAVTFPDSSTKLYMVRLRYTYMTPLP